MPSGTSLPFLTAALASIAVAPPALGPANLKRSAAQPLPASRVLDGISFAVEPTAVYLPAQELRRNIGLPVRWSSRGRSVSLKGRRLDRKFVRRLLDGSPVVSLRGLEERGFQVRWDRQRALAVVKYRGKVFGVRDGVKRVAVNRATQRLRAWQGKRYLGETRVSTGASGFTTPAGSFAAGPFKAARHFSRQYNMAPMPYTVQVRGNVCIHGSTSVPARPASHGCVRVPLTGLNPARWVYEWVDVGSPVVIADRWPAVKQQDASFETASAR
ncbi:MAG TPA: L,D-transpeptidase [Armatimonadota bacterium]|nr:L,D-transpeptidase [Armatimonadota bacterium]